MRASVTKIDKCFIKSNVEITEASGRLQRLLRLSLRITSDVLSLYLHLLPDAAE